MKTTLRILLLSLLALYMTACGAHDNDSGASSDCTDCWDDSGWVCVSILDQFDQQMDCIYRYDFGASAEGYESYEQCENGQLLIVGAPGSYRINAECGGLIGHVNVALEALDNGTYSSRLVDSLCYNDTYGDKYPVVLDTTQSEAQLSDWLGYSTATRCSNWFEYYETYNTEISSISLACAPGTCDPHDGPDYLEATGEYGHISRGWPTSLNVLAHPERVPTGEEVTVLVNLRELNSPEQELTLPVVIRGPEE